MNFRVVTAAERPTVPTDTTVLMADDDKDGCPRCGGMVSVNFNVNICLIYFFLCCEKVCGFDN